MKHLSGTRACLTPIAAGTMYARQQEWEAQERLPWSDIWHDTVIFEFRRLLYGNHGEDYAGWTQLPGTSNRWDNARRTDLESGRWTLEGRCGDFCPELKRRLRGRGIPGKCLSLILCKTPDGRDHMVLGIETDRGTAICCQIQGCWHYGDPAFEGYQWIARETPNGWEDLETVSVGSLEDLVG